MAVVMTVLASASQSPLAAPFRLSDVLLEKGSRFELLSIINEDHLLSLNISDIGCQISSAANLTGTFMAPTCTFVDDSEYFGHYFGHFMSSTALSFNATGHLDLQAAGAAAVDLMARAQAAWSLVPGYEGYVFSYNSTPWDYLLGLHGPSLDCQRVCVPFYVYHKLLAGLLDQYQLAGNQQALAIMTGMIDWLINRIGDTIARGGQQLWQSVLDTEFGGVNEVLYNAYLATGNETYLATAGLFVHWNWTDPLVLSVDELAFNHANTHIPQVIGDAVGFEITSNATKAAIVQNFFSFLNESHSFSTGGSNDRQYWGIANQVGTSFHGTTNEGPIDQDTQESCTQYNILKLSRRLFGWNGGADTRWADHYERALYNGIVGNLILINGSEGLHSHPLQREDGHHHHHHVHDETDAHSAAITTHRISNSSNVSSYPAFIKYLPLGPVAQPNGTSSSSFSTASQKPWNPANQKFVCCWGTLSESFSKLGDSIYFSSMPAAATSTWGDADRIDSSNGAYDASGAGRSPGAQADGALEGALPVLFINQFVSSSLTWWEMGGVIVTQSSDFPYDTTTFLATNVTILAPGDDADVTPALGRAAAPQSWTMALRIPFWAVTPTGNRITLNGELLANGTELVPGSYFNISRNWTDGDAVSLYLQPSLRWEAINDNRSDWANVGAVMYGPILLAGIQSAPLASSSHSSSTAMPSSPLLGQHSRSAGGTGTGTLAIDLTKPLDQKIHLDCASLASASASSDYAFADRHQHEHDSPRAAWGRQGPLRFTAPLWSSGTSPTLNGNRSSTNANITLIPLMDVARQSYSVYWNVTSGND